MSTVRRLYDHPKNAELRGTHYVQTCCDGNAPYWDTYRIYDDKDAWASRDSDRNMTAYKQSDSMLVQDDTGASDNNREVLEFDINGKVTGSSDQMKGYVRVEGPNSGYRPDFLTVEQWMAWQGVEFSSDSRGVKLANGQYTTQLPNPPRWRRTRIRDDKMRWGKGPGGWAANDWMFLWCPQCETALEKAWSDTLEFIPVAARGIAMIVSYIPVYGTVISFCINATVTLAEGGAIDDAMLDGIGGSLPGQPASGMTFSAARAIAKGERIDRAAIASLPVDKSVKDILYVADDLIYGIASGQRFDETVYRTVYNRMPPQAQQAMEYAHRIINGENVPQMILTEAERAVANKVRSEAQALIDAAKAQGQAAIDSARKQADSLFLQYAMETGYQVGLLDLPVQMRDAIQTGIVVGIYGQQHGFIGTFGSAPEKNVDVNETYLQKGQRIIDAGARYRGKLLSDIVKTGLTVDIEDFDALNKIWHTVKKTFKVNGPWASNEGQVDDAWRRGFIIATGVCEGMSQKGPGQLAVYQTMAEHGGRNGFDAGQAVAYERTLHGDWSQAQGVTKLASSTTSALLEAIKENPPLPKSTATQALGVPKQLLSQATIDPKVYAQKMVDRARWVAYYNQL
jgi:hypothetical protein